MPHRTLRFATFLAPNMLPVYAFVVRRVAERLGVAAELVVGSGYDGLAEQADLSFVCGLPYVHLARRGEPIEPIAAPVLRGERYGGRPVYFSDVIVRRDSPFSRFEDLRGRSWCYNEPWSQSGYGVTRQRLIEMGETEGFFGRVVQAGFHERAIRLVLSGEVDASAIDSQVLAVALRDHPDWAARLRVIDTLGPSTIQPVVASRRLPRELRDDVAEVLIEMGDDPEGQERLGHGFVERYVPVGDADYDDVRTMLHTAEAEGFLTIR
jgi:phosphonate transport system substrate-binding protein